MKSRFTFVWMLLLTGVLSAQMTIDFEEAGLPVDSFANGEDGSGGFTFGDLFLPNTFTDFGGGCCWSGWAVSTTRDTMTPGPGNQYSAVTGSGHNGSATYALTFISGSSKLVLSGEAQGKEVEGFYITNNTYAYLSMLEGDSYAKKFGGPSGTEEDFFFLAVRGYANGQLTADSVTFYLADYRFPDSEDDYIVKDWEFMDLSSLGPVDSLLFTLNSSDVGFFGINTPAYFCMDDLSIGGLSTSVFSTPKATTIDLYPNPADEQVRVEWSGEPGPLTVFDGLGRMVKQWLLAPGVQVFPIDDLVPGTYFLRAADQQQIYTGKLQVQK